MKRILMMGLIVAAMAAQLSADGKMFWREEIPPKIPYQRAFILFKDGTQTLVLQSRYEIPETVKKATLGWIVPVPAVPEVASMPAGAASEMFRKLSMDSLPRVTWISELALNLLFVFLLIVAGLSVLTLLLCLVSFVPPVSPWLIKRRRKLAEASILALLVCFVAFIIIPTTLSAGSKSAGVEVISQQRVGIYDVRVVRGDNADDLISWLKTNEFKFGARDTAAFNSYISRGWCFVVAIINPDRDQHESEIVSEGLAAPLILRFPHANPVYPLALTGTGDFETEILIYLASDTKMSCDERLTLRFAGHVYSSAFISLDVYTEPKGFFDLEFDGEPEYPYLCKFKDRLTPAEMSQDINFTPAKDNTPYREHIVEW
jgi:hypothetical protein